MSEIGHQEIRGAAVSGETVAAKPPKIEKELPYVEIGGKRMLRISGGQLTPQAQEAERALGRAYSRSLVNSEEFEQQVRQQVNGLEAALGPNHADVRELENKWEPRIAWRRFAKDALPDFEGDHEVMFATEKQAGERFTSLVNKEINLETVLEPMGVRQAIVRLYPNIMNGDFFFGRAGEVLTIQGNQVIKVDASNQSAYGIDSTTDCRIALEVLRAWLVHPPRTNKAVWDVYANDHDGLARWYPAEKWRVNDLTGRNISWEGYLVKETLRRENLVEAENGTGNYWEVFGEKMLNGSVRHLAIDELVNGWGEVKRVARQGGGLDLGGFYDRARKIMATGNAIHDLVTTGISPENVVKIIIEKERFKYLGGKERTTAWSALYTKVWEMLTERTPLTVRQEKLKNINLLRSLYALRKIDETQLNRLLAVVEGVPEIESLHQRILSPEGQILERGHSVFVWMAAAVESIPGINLLASIASFGILSPKWEPKSQETDQLLVRRLGINPLSAEIAAAGLLGYLQVLSVAGTLSWNTFVPAFLAANVGGIILTNITDFLNERRFGRFHTEMTYREWPLKEGNVGGMFLAPALLVPGLIGSIWGRIRHGRNEPQNAIGRRNFLAGAAGLAGLAAAGGIGIGQTTEQAALRKAEKERAEFNALPKEQQDEIIRRAKVEKQNPYYQKYKDPREPWSWSPFVINDSVVQDLRKKVGPTWMFESSRKRELQSWFGRPFTDQEIEEFRRNPRKIVSLLQGLESQKKIPREVVDFYR